MSLIVRLAGRNLLRHKRRTILTMVVIVAAVGVLILGEGFIGGLDESIIAGAETGLSGHVLARPKGYPTAGLQHPLDDLLELDLAARAVLDRESEAWTERTLFLPTLISGPDALRVRAIGYDPVRDPKVFPRTLWRLTGKEPEVPTEPDADPQLLVSRGVAKLLHLEPGSTVILQVRTHAGAINALRFAVTGILSAGNPALDVNAVLMPHAVAARLVGAEAPTHVILRLRNRNDAPQVAAAVRAALPQADVVTWIDETADMMRLQGFRRRALDLLFGILMALAGFGIANTILMAAYERVRELGTLRAMGMTPGGVIGLFLVEGTFMGVMGGALGVLWGGGITYWWSQDPIDFTKGLDERGGPGLQIATLIYTQLNPTVTLLAFAFGAVIAAVASIYPARVAAGMPPADAVRAD